MNRIFCFVGVAGFEPATSCSQSRRDDRATLHPDSVILYDKSFYFRMKILSGWQDSNLRPPAPKAGAMTGLRYTPIDFIIVGANLRLHLGDIQIFLRIFFRNFHIGFQIFVSSTRKIQNHNILRFKINFF